MPPIEVFATGIKVFDRQKVCSVVPFWGFWSIDLSSSEIILIVPKKGFDHLIQFQSWLQNASIYMGHTVSGYPLYQATMDIHAHKSWMIHLFITFSSTSGADTYATVFISVMYKFITQWLICSVVILKVVNLVLTRPTFKSTMFHDFNL